MFSHTTHSTTTFWKQQKMMIKQVKNELLTAGTSRFKMICPISVERNEKDLKLGKN